MSSTRADGEPRAALGTEFCNALQCRQWMEARSIAERVLQQTPQALDWWLALASVFEAQQDERGAIEVYQQALSVRPDAPELYLNLANAFYRLREFDAAMEVYRMALAQRSDYAEAHNNLALALRQQQHYGQALEHLQQAVEVQPDYVDGWCNLAGVLAQSDHLEEAVAAFRRAIELAPQQAGTYFQLAKLMEQMGRRKDALGFYDHTLNLAPEFEQARQNRDQLQRQADESGDPQRNAPHQGGAGAPPSPDAIAQAPGPTSTATGICPGSRESSPASHRPASVGAAASGNREAFNHIHDVSHAARRTSAQQILPPLFRELQPRSMLDVGCGLGAWLEVAAELGVAELQGLDGEWIQSDKLRIPEASFRAADLDRPFDLERRFDMAVCLEVAEHLGPEAADGLVQSLVRHSDVVLFSAAIPGQGGNGHVNEQFQHHWAEHFAAHDYVAVDCVRRPVWLRNDVFWWLQQNTILYVKRASLCQWPNLQTQVVSHLASLSVVHPALYLQWAQRGQQRDNAA